MCVCVATSQNFLQFFRVPEIGMQSVVGIWLLFYCPCRIGYVVYKTENVQAH